MNLNDYFSTTDGTGVLATANVAGDVDAAIYAAPHVIDETTVGFIMRPRRSVANVDQNPKAAYLFWENAPAYKGVRLYLEKSGVETDPQKVNLLRRSHHGGDEDRAVLVYFRVTEVRPLIGDTLKDEP